MGGRKGRSAVDAVAALTGRAQMALEEGEAYGVVLADVKGAFDYIQHNILIQVLAVEMMNVRSLNSIHIYLYSRGLSGL